MSSRAAATRQGLLDAAAAVFGAAGYHDASVSEIVATAGASTGSLYHHFVGGKADLYAELFTAWQDRMELRAAQAVARARKDGVTDPGDLFAAGARAYLLGCWAERGYSTLFRVGDGPPGWVQVARQNRREWIAQNQLLLRISDDTFGSSLVVIVTALLAEAGHEVSLAETEAEAEILADQLTDVVRRVVGG